MMRYELSLGIDMSKLTFDYSLLSSTGEVLAQGNEENEPKTILNWIKGIESIVGECNESLVICMEDMGYYGASILRALKSKKTGVIWLESSLQIKRSIGITRGKTDKIDSERIAMYALDYQRRLVEWSPKPKSIERLSLLVSHRDRLVKKKQSIEVPLKEQKAYTELSIQEELEGINNKIISSLAEGIEILNSKIEEVLKTEDNFKKQTEIIRSIPGFGPVIASKLILFTEGFSKIKTARKLACYAGVAPFEYSSGTSIKGKTRVSHIANKNLKKMLHLAALVTIRKGHVMYGYYQRKIKEGKNKMSIINAIRNKLIHILMACIKNDTMYQKNYKHSLVIT